MKKDIANLTRPKPTKPLSLVAQNHALVHSIVQLAYVHFITLNLNISATRQNIKNLLARF